MSPGLHTNTSVPDRAELLEPRLLLVAQLRAFALELSEDDPRRSEEHVVRKAGRRMLRKPSVVSAPAVGGRHVADVAGQVVLGDEAVHHVLSW
jgi:hypothetical protein